MNRSQTSTHGIACSGDKIFYRCSRYNNNGKEACSTHTIDAKVLESVVLADIQYHANMAVKNDQTPLDRLFSFSGHEQEREKAAQEKTLRDATNRISFIQDASKRLFEEKITGNVPDSLFKKMFADYERELAELETRAAEMRHDLAESESNEADVQRWLALVKDCASIISLDRATAYKLIDHVDVHEQADEYGHVIQSVQIKYNFVGCLS